MSITPPIFKNIRTTTAQLWNTDIIEYTKTVWISVGSTFTPGKWSNGAGNAKDILEIGEQMDGSWRIRGSLQYLGTAFQDVTTIFLQDDIPELRGITFAIQQGQGFAVTDGALGSNVFNLSFSKNTPAALQVGLSGSAGVAPTFPSLTIFTCDMTIYPVDS